MLARMQVGILLSLFMRCYRSRRKERNSKKSTSSYCIHFNLLKLGGRVVDFTDCLGPWLSQYPDLIMYTGA